MTPEKLQALEAELIAADRAALDPNPENPGAANRSIDRALAMIEQAKEQAQ